MQEVLHFHVDSEQYRETPECSYFEPSYFNLLTTSESTVSPFHFLLVNARE